MKKYSKLLLVFIAFALIMSSTIVLSGCSENAGTDITESEVNETVIDESFVFSLFLLIFNWISLFISGIAFPIIPLVLSLIFANNKHYGKKKYWYIVTGLSAMLIVLTLIMCIVVFFIIF